ncbi:FkbM family methyltransferase [Rhizobium petrolearium]|uniref:FkbM family methyltransferase n=1 Tax=Neorhizobium petrolearium TaxID=515361 RepID=UPI001AE4A84F|nr:FkbM family methyltransferase [Neorhizobium petrolearium]MBP1842022.1 FkbM family methyltransferase [Neorhizobium petrolearium]
MANNFHPMSNHIALQTWQRYLRNYSRREIETKIDLLKALCDEESSPEIDCFVERVFCHPPLARRGNFHIEYRAIAESTRSPWAIQEVKKRPKVDVAKMREDYDLVNVDIGDQFIRPETFLYHCGLYFIPEAKSVIDGRIMIDGGAYRGESAAVLRKNFPASEVHAFEPNADNFRVLREVSRNTRFGEGIVPVNKGLSSSSHAVKMTGGGHGTKLSPTAPSEGALEVTSIDDYILGQNLKLGFFKLDIEGLEFDVVKGAVKILKRDRPAFAISIYHTPQDFLDIAPFIKSLGLNYNLMVRHLHPQLTSFFGEFMLIGYPR